MFENNLTISYVFLIRMKSFSSSYLSFFNTGAFLKELHYSFRTFVVGTCLELVWCLYCALGAAVEAWLAILNPERAWGLETPPKLLLKKEDKEWRKITDQENIYTLPLELYLHAWNRISQIDFWVKCTTHCSQVESSIEL